MKTLIYKELRLSASPLTRIFTAFSLMTLIPGYPIALGAVFVCLGIFYSFQSGRESGDILYSLLLPVPKGDVVRGKYLFSCLFEGFGFVLMAALTAVRMTALRDLPVYVQNALMPANPVFLAWVLLIYAAFNLLFLGGFFRTAWKLGGPLLSFMAAAIALVGLGEALPHFPGLGFLGSVSGPDLLPQAGILAAAAAVCALVTWLSMRAAVRRFEKLDF